MNEWISVNDDMPKEHESIFRGLKGKSLWKPGMFEKISDEVIVTAQHSEKKETMVSHTCDGKWREIPAEGVVTHWMPMPDPAD